MPDDAQDIIISKTILHRIGLIDSRVWELMESDKAFYSDRCIYYNNIDIPTYWATDLILNGAKTYNMLFLMYSCDYVRNQFFILSTEKIVKSDMRHWNKQLHMHLIITLMTSSSYPLQCGFYVCTAKMWRLRHHFNNWMFWSLRKDCFSLYCWNSIKGLSFSCSEKSDKKHLLSLFKLLRNCISIRGCSVYRLCLINVLSSHTIITV